jgi:hypothetical protein
MLRLFKYSIKNYRLVQMQNSAEQERIAAKKSIHKLKIMRNMEIGDNMTPNLPIINWFIK